MIAYRFTLPDNFYACSVQSGSRLPGNATWLAPPDGPWDRVWPRWTGTEWEMVEDHRERKEPYFPASQEQEATLYWLPEDTHDSQPRTMKEPGPLPEGAVLSRPEKPLAVAQEEKRSEIETGYETALVASITMPSANPTPLSVAVEASALLAVDPDAVDSIKGALSARRIELLDKVDAAKTLPEVTAITVSYPV